MRSLISKAPPLAALCLVITLCMVSYANADQSKTVTAVLEGNESKQISIPQGYRPHLAKLNLVGSGTDEFTVTVAVGKQQTDLSWPGSPSRSRPLPPKDWNGGSAIPVTVSASPVFPFVLNVEIICLKQDPIK